MCSSTDCTRKPGGYFLFKCWRCKGVFREGIRGPQAVESSILQHYIGAAAECQPAQKPRFTVPLSSGGDGWRLSYNEVLCDRQRPRRSGMASNHTGSNGPFELP